MLKHAPYSSKPAQISVATTTTPAPELPFSQKPFADQVSINVGHDLAYGAQETNWQIMHMNAGTVSSVLQNQILTNLNFINKWVKQVHTPALEAEKDLAWQAYLFWLSWPSYTGTLEEYNAEPLAQYSFTNFGGWDGSESSFYGYGGWWYYIRRKAHFNSINLM